MDNWLDKLFSNIGDKLKGIAEFFFILQLVFGLIAGLYIIAIFPEKLLLVGILLILLTPVLAFLNTCFIYAFGEAVVKLTEIERNTRKEESAPKTSVGHKKRKNDIQN